MKIENISLQIKNKIFFEACATYFYQAVSTLLKAKPNAI